MKVAIVGSGAAACGVLAGLEQALLAGADVTVFDIGEPLRAPPHAGGSRLDRVELSQLYRRLRGEHGSSFPPPKTHFGQTLSRLPVDGEPLLWRSEHRGGLTNFWGGGMFPFTDTEFKDWPIGRAALEPHYRTIAAKVGICGEADDPLATYFGGGHVNRPPLRTSPVIAALRDTIARHGAAAGDYRVIAGASRLALETRDGHPNACSYSGECMLGCTREAIWSARGELARFERSGLVRRYIRGRVLRVAGRRLHVRVEGKQEREETGLFDRIYLAAGCIGSTEIVMRSFGIQRGPRMIDSSILTFPLFYLGGQGGLLGGAAPYFSLCNLTVMGLPLDPGLDAAQVSVYPAFDHLWRYYTPEAVWGPMGAVGRLIRWRAMLGRVYLSGPSADRLIDFQLDGDDLVLRRSGQPDVSRQYRSFMTSLRRAGNHGGFYIPPVAPIAHGTSSHYAGTLPYGDGPLPVSLTGRIAPGVYLADASTFPNLPAISPTYTIMANACRTACESLQE